MRNGSAVCVNGEDVPVIRSGDFCRVSFWDIVDVFKKVFLVCLLFIFSLKGFSKVRSLLKAYLFTPSGILIRDVSHLIKGQDIICDGLGGDDDVAAFRDVMDGLKGGRCNS